MKSMILAAATLAALISYGSFTAKAETTECNEISALPATINVQGIYCLKRNLVTANTIGNVITINTNNVTIDLNGWKLGGSAAGAGTQTYGIYAQDRKNITIRNGSIRGFQRAIYLRNSTGGSSGHIIEDILADGNRLNALQIEGSNLTIRRNIVTNTGSGIGSSTVGIFVIGGIGVAIYENTVSGVTETGSVWGMFVSSVDGADVRDNRVFDLNGGGADYGIIFNAANRVVAKGNTVATFNGGANGIGDNGTSSNVACVNNQASGFSSFFGGCDTSLDNSSF